MQDNEFVKKVHKIMNGDIRENFWIIQDVVLTMKGKVCVPDVDDLRRAIMEEPIIRLMLCIRVVPRCTKILKKIIGGLV